MKSAPDTLGAAQDLDKKRYLLTHIPPYTMATNETSPAHTRSLDRDHILVYAQSLAGGGHAYRWFDTNEEVEPACILRACDSHDELLDAARGLYDLITKLQENGCDLFDDHQPLLSHCSAVLRKHEPC
jgi:hypothetical protein